MKWKPQDVIAILILVGTFTLMGLGHNSALSWTTLGVVCAYYGIDLTPWFKAGRRQAGEKKGEVKDNE